MTPAWRAGLTAMSMRETIHDCFLTVPSTPHTPNHGGRSGERARAAPRRPCQPRLRRGRGGSQGTGVRPRRGAVPVAPRGAAGRRARVRGARRLPALRGRRRRRLQPGAGAGARRPGDGGERWKLGAPCGPGGLPARSPGRAPTAPPARRPHARQHAEALALAKRAVALRPGCGRLRHALGRVLEKADPPRWAEAADAYERACEKEPGSVQVCVWGGGGVSASRGRSSLERPGKARCGRQRPPPIPRPPPNPADHQTPPTTNPRTRCCSTGRAR
jgi:hypothetical protein